MQYINRGGEKGGRGKLARDGGRIVALLRGKRGSKGKRNVPAFVIREGPRALVLDSKKRRRDKTEKKRETSNKQEKIGASN